jgi:hypothetical protein
MGVLSNGNLQTRNEEMKISMDKEYKTVGGNDVRLYAVDGDDSYPIHGAVHLKRLDWEWIGGKMEKPLARVKAVQMI